jgi:L-fuculose-phosphate aldolase
MLPKHSLRCPHASTSGALGDKSALMLSHHGLLIAAPTIEEACVKALAFERAAKMQLLAAAAGKIQPIEVKLGKEAHDWILKPKRNTAAFNHYARRALRNPHNRDCIELSASGAAFGRS